MQYKKKFINDKILEAGREEYLSKGFRAGNISVIATAAGVPVGNLYRYFDGKNGLLEAIVKPTYLEVPKAISRLSNFDTSDKSMTMQDHMFQITDRLLQLFDECGKEIIILVDKCATTRYDDFSQKLTDQISEIVFEKLYQAKAEDRLMAELIAKAFVDSIFEMVLFM